MVDEYEDVPNVSRRIYFKVTILGKSGTGKTSLAYRYTKKEFSLITPTIGSDHISHDITVGYDDVRLQMWDTCGMETYAPLSATFVRGSHGVILVYDITCKKSFDALPYWLEQVQNNMKASTTTPVIMLIGNKTDLEEHRQVSVTEGQNFAQEHDMDYIEASAKSGDHVDHIFTLLTQKMLHAKDEEYSSDDEIVVLETSQKSHKKSICC